MKDVTITKFDAVIFDLDGVVVHTDMYHYLAWKALATYINVPFNEEINHRLRGVSRMESLAIILEKYHGTAFTQKELEGMATKKNALYRESLKKLNSNDVAVDVKETLALIKSRGIRIAIGSSSKNAPLILKQIGLLNWFDVISDGNNITHSKPHPEVFLKAAEMLNIKLERCLVVEDAFSGVKAAKAANMKVAAIGKLGSELGADYTLSSFKQLKEILEL